MLHLLFSALCLFFAHAEPPAPHLAYGCQIVDTKGELLRAYPGMACLYLPDGRVISAGDRQLSMLSSDGRTLWRKSVFCHHQPKLTADEKGFLVFSSSIHRVRGEPIRFDRLDLYDFSGNVTRSFDFFAHRQELLRHAPEWARKFRGRAHPSVHPVKFEFSHANSIFEVAPGTDAGGIPAFARGGYLLNINGLAVVVLLDRDLKKILWSMPQSLKPDPTMGWHDARLRPGGKLMFYNNTRTPSSSSVDMIDLKSGARDIVYEASPPSDFWGQSQGGAQPLENGNLMLTEFNPLRPPRIFAVNARREVVWSFLATQGGQSGAAVTGLQECRQEDLSKFLSRNKGL